MVSAPVGHVRTLAVGARRDWGCEGVARGHRLQGLVAVHLGTGNSSRPLSLVLLLSWTPSAWLGEK